MFSTSLELSLGDSLVTNQWLSLILPHIGIESKLSWVTMIIFTVVFELLQASRKEI